MSRPLWVVFALPSVGVVRHRSRAEFPPETATQFVSGLRWYFSLPFRYLRASYGLLGYSVCMQPQAVS